MTVIGPIEALGTIWYVECFDVCEPDVIAAGITTFLDRFEDRYSRFREHSWLSVLNQTGKFTNPDPEFVTLLKKATAFYQASNQVFNIAVGERMVKSGYDCTYSFTAADVIPAIPPLELTLTVTDDLVTLQHGQLDLGGLGKGFAIDQLAVHLKQEHSLQHFLINGGGDMYVTSNHGESVEITLAHPTNAGEGIGAVRLRHQGFAASSPYVRSWKDPKTNTTHNHLHTDADTSSYVVAREACDADAWATILAINPEVRVPTDLQSLLVKAGNVLHTDEIFTLN